MTLKCHRCHQGVTLNIILVKVEISQHIYHGDTGDTYFSRISIIIKLSDNYKFYSSFMKFNVTLSPRSLFI